MDQQPFEPEIVSAFLGGTNLKIRWQQPDGPSAMQFSIFASDNGRDQWQDLSGPLAAATVLVGDAYEEDFSVFEKKFFKIRATNSYGESLDSRVVSVKFLGEDLTVEASAHVQTSPLAVVLDWPLDIEATQYTVFRRTKGQSDWGMPIGDAPLPGNATGFVDVDVADGKAYEYKIVQDQILQTLPAPQNLVGTGYVYAGINVPLVDHRGTTVLIVDNAFSENLADEIARLQQDLVGDGWKVIRHDVARTAPATDVKALIKSDYDAPLSDVKQVILLGHVAVPYSGDVAPDRQHDDVIGAVPADVYYGDMDGIWNDLNDYPNTAYLNRQWNDAGDGKFDPSFLSDSLAPELAVGRIDMWGMTRTPGTYSIDEERFLLQRYLDRDHSFRQGELDVPRQALLDTNYGIGMGGFDNLSALVGEPNVEIGDYFAKATQSPYLWGFGDGGGSPPRRGDYEHATGVGTTVDFMNQESKVVFTILWGWYFADWDGPNSFLRAPLAGQGYGLTSAYGGRTDRPQWSYYRMGLGETIGEATVYTQNGGSSFQPSDIVVSTALMGDPSLRMHVVKPPSDVAAIRQGGAIKVTWLASQDAGAIGFQGYNIYRSTPTGSFVKLNASPRTDLAFTDTTALAGNYTYMVRAVKLESGSSGTYYNTSQGAFDNMGAAALLGVDAATQGDWIGAYGAEGYDIVGDSADIPSYVIASVTGATTQVSALSSTDERGLLRAADSERLVAAWHAQPSLTIDVQFTDGLAHQVSLYALDWDDAGRAEQVEVFDAQNGSLLLSTDLREFSGGTFLKLRLAGNVQIKVTSLTESDAVISGIFFDS